MLMREAIVYLLPLQDGRCFKLGFSEDGGKRIAKHVETFKGLPESCVCLRFASSQLAHAAEKMMKREIAHLFAGWHERCDGHTEVFFDFAMCSRDILGKAEEGGYAGFLGCSSLSEYIGDNAMAAYFGAEAHPHSYVPSVARLEMAADYRRLPMAMAHCVAELREIPFRQFRFGLGGEFWVAHYQINALESFVMTLRDETDGKKLCLILNDLCQLEVSPDLRPCHRKRMFAPIRKRRNAEDGSLEFILEMQRQRKVTSISVVQPFWDALLQLIALCTEIRSPWPDAIHVDTSSIRVLADIRIFAPGRTGKSLSYY